MKKIKALLYCTKEKPYLYDLRNIMGIFGGYNVKQTNLDFLLLNGTIPCECDFEVEEICSEKLDVGVGYEPLFYTETIDDITKGSCLTQFEIENYLGCKEGGEVVGYALHIKNLHIFDEPRELSDYYKFDGIYSDINNWKTIDKAPQNMMYAYDLTSELCLSETFNRYLKGKILISIKPQWLCKILNGEKTIEVRRKVLKEMLENE